MIERLKGLVRHNKEPLNVIPATLPTIFQEEGLVVPDVLISDTEIRSLIGVFIPFIYKPFPNAVFINPSLQDIPSSDERPDWRTWSENFGLVLNSRFGGDQQSRTMDKVELAVWNKFTDFNERVLERIKTNSLYVLKTEKGIADDSTKSPVAEKDLPLILNKNIRAEDLEPFDPNGMTYGTWVEACLAYYAGNAENQPPFNVRLNVGTSVADGSGRRVIFRDEYKLFGREYIPFHPISMKLEIGEGRLAPYNLNINWATEDPGDPDNSLFKPRWTVQPGGGHIYSTPRIRLYGCAISEPTKPEEIVFVGLDHDHEMRVLFWQLKRFLKPEENPLVESQDQGLLYEASDFSLS